VIAKLGMEYAGKFNVLVSLNLDKAKPFARRGRKAAGLLGKMAELPKDESSIAWLFLVNQQRLLKERR
jgi:hypothetical protein